MAPQDKNYRALIVDDEYYLGQILAQALTHDGIEAVAVTDVDTALSHLQQESFDIVISDIYLPGKTGVDLFHTAMQKFPEIPFIFMTGNPDLEMAVDFLKKGGYDYIVKPFMIPDFIKKVNHVIQRSNQRRQEQHLVSDLKQILNKRLQELRIFQDIIESSTDGLIVTDTEGIIVKTNMGLEHITGINDAVLRLRPLSTLEKTTFPQLNFQDILETIQARGNWSGETTGNRLSGEEFIAQISFFPILNESGEAFAYAALIKDVTEQRRMEQELISSLKKTTQAQEATIFGLARLAEYRDQATGFHLERIRSYCRELAEALHRHPEFSKQVDRHFIETLYRTAPLHDIGKVGIPDYILLKAGKLSEQEFEIMKQHTIIGYQTLYSIQQQYGDMDFLKMGIEITYCHHERFDGKGYPRGLKGNEIPLSAQILSIADVYDALTTERVYKKAFSHKKSLEIMMAERGKHFEPRLFDVFLSIADKFDAIRKQFLEKPHQSVFVT